MLQTGLLAAEATSSLKVVSVVACGAVMFGAPLFTGLRTGANSLQQVALSGATGGLGMLLGSMLDRFFWPSRAPLCHMLTAHLQWSSILNWMTVLMLLVCIPACSWRSANCAKERRPWLTCCLSALGMEIGMVGGGRWLAHPIFGAMLDMAAAMHFGMLVGMMTAETCVRCVLSVIQNENQGCPS